MSFDTAAGGPAAYAFEQLESSQVLGGNASDLIEGAWAQAEQIRETARQAGYAEGHATGFAEARAEVDSAISALSTALGAFAALREELTTALEHDAAELAFKLSEQVLAGALDVQPERVIDVARNALRRVTDRRRVVLLVNPADLEVISGSVETLKGELGGIEHCDVQSDRRIDRGGVILRTEAGEIDVTIDSQVERAREIVATTLRTNADAG
jgi:flagellar assembly protein FliH